MENWGTLVPEDLGSLRRQQDLGLAASVRSFNDKAVPGVGGLWFPMPMVWSVLAVSLAERLGRSALPIGNAIEALTMCNAIEALTMHPHQGASDRSVSDARSRLRGARKLREQHTSFSNLVRPGVYVVQPFRMAMVQPLVELGFVTGSRYGAFRLTDVGKKLLKLPDVSKWEAALFSWARGEKPGRTIADLSPLVPLPGDVRKLIGARILEGHGVSDEGAARRRALINLGKGPSVADLESEGPLPGLSAAHWADLRAGTAFIDLRDTALKVLRMIEGVFRFRWEGKSSERLRLTPEEAAASARQQIKALTELARHSFHRIKAANEGESIAFAEECRDLSPARVVQRLAERDGSVITMRDGYLMPVPAGGDLLSTNIADDRGGEPVDKAEDFAPQLYRLRYLHFLMEELAGRKNPGSPGYPRAEGK